MTVLGGVVFSGRHVFHLSHALTGQHGGYCLSFMEGLAILLKSCLSDVKINLKYR